MLNHNVVWRGGTFFRAYHHGRQLAKRGHEVTVLTISPRKCFGFREEMRDGVRVVETPDLFWGRGRSGWDPWDTVHRIRFVRRESWDLVHAFDSRPAVILPALALQRRGTPLVLDWADWSGRGGTNAERPGRLLNMAVAPLETFFEEAFRTRADGSTVISTALFRRAVALGVEPNTLLHLVHGSDVEGIQPVEQDVARERLRISTGMMVIGHLGVLQPRDAEFLCSAFRIVRQKVSDCKLAVIGRHRCRLDRYRLPSEALVETGPVSHDQLVHYLGTCDILLLPLANSLANRARWPSRVNDYLAAGRPVVATSVGDVAGLIREHHVGMVAEPEVEDFAAAVVALLRDRALRTECAMRARLLAETKLAWSVLTDALEDFYLRVLRGRRNGMLSPR